MMNDTNFASLSSGLLARKGGAKPAMRPQVAIMPKEGFGDGFSDGFGAGFNGGSAAHNLEDLGWNDMGEDDAPPSRAQTDAKESMILHLTPEPANQTAERDAKIIDRAAQDELAQSNPVHGDPIALHTARLPAESPAKPPIVEQQEGLSRKLSGQDGKEPDRHTAVETEPDMDAEAKQTPKPAAPRRRRASALSRGKRAAFTLRLDAERHLKLRLACTLRNVSAQQLVTDALDTMLGTMPELADFARHAKSADANDAPRASNE
ncbi:MAG: hypothetical protein WA948_13770 [Pontixanthobacter sp.]